MEEVATLAARLGWSYEVLLDMTSAERRLWLVASERATSTAGVPVPGGASGVPAGSPVPAGGPPVARAAGAGGPAAAVPPARLTTEDERRARLVELLEEMTARRRKP